MTTLGSLVSKGVTPNPGQAGPAVIARIPGAFDLASVIADIGVDLAKHNLTASITNPGSAVNIGSSAALLAVLNAWTNQDDDAHDTCDSLVACRNPLHPGPCKGWKHTLHAVSPGAWHQIEGERVRKANERRLKRISDLKAQGKPIPRHLLAEIKPKPAPTGQHPAHNARPVPLSQVGQKADLAGGQAHTAGQSVSQAAGIKTSVAPPLPLGPKGKKPSVAGRGPAFVITQPKVTDTYKLGKADKITPDEWNALPDGDKKAIRDELAAIKQRGFGPQQKKADELLARLPEKGLAPGSSNTVTTPGGTVVQKINPTPGKVSLGQAVKQTAPSAPSKTLGTPPTAAPKRTGPDVVGQVKRAVDPAAKLSPVARMFVYRKMDKAQFDSLDAATKKQVLADIDHQIHNASGSMSGQHARDLKDRFAPSAPAPAGVQPSAPLAPGTAAHVQHAVAVANRTAPKAAMGKTHVDAYGKLTKAEFDALPADKQKTIRDDLANAKAKFLDPKKQQAAADLLNRFGSSHPVSAPSAPGGAKGYSDPMNEAVKAVNGGGSTDDVLKAIGRLTPEQVNKLDDADKTKVLHRLAFVATHPKATAEQKAKATAYGRAINGKGPDKKDLGKLDHEPSLSELHAHETKTGIANALASHQAVTDALKAADGVDTGTHRSASQHVMTPAREAQVKALSALTKQQFDALPAADQTKVLNALQTLHLYKDGYDTRRDQKVGDAITAYTGKHPAIHRLEQAEQEFRDGKITGDQVHSAFVTARVQANMIKDPAAHKAVNDLGARIARDNPTLPMYARVTLAGEQDYGNAAYSAIGMARMKHSWDDAPRLSQSDMRDLFKPTDADLAKVDPIHAQAVRDLREHILKTGLAPNSPWSTPTRNGVVDALLNTDARGEIPPDRMKLFTSLSIPASARVERVLKKRLDDQTDPYAKTETWIALRQLEGAKPLNDRVRDAVYAASQKYGNAPAKVDIYRRIVPDEYDDLPKFVQDAIFADLTKAQQAAESRGPVDWSVADNAFKVMPLSIAGNLMRSRPTFSDRAQRNAFDIASYGTKIISPSSRIEAYDRLGKSQFAAMPQNIQTDIRDDLTTIANTTGSTSQQRYAALFARDVTLHTGSTPALNLDQLVAVASVNPVNRQPDGGVAGALHTLSKHDFDNLHPAYREAIDERIKGLPGPDQQLLNGKFHPGTAANNPSGLAPTANVQPHVQAALDTIYGVHPKSHTMAHQLSTYGALRGSDFAQLNPQEQGHLLSDLSFIQTTAKGPSADKARKLLDRFTPAGTPSGQMPTGAAIPPANAVPGQTRYATPLKGLTKAADSGTSGDGWITLPSGGRVWGKHGAAGLLLMHQDPQTGEKRYLMVQRGPAISDPGKWTFPGGASDSKETPHQGAARETIEELGLKDNALADALIHGDHVFSVPGHSWKYTTVAAQVPTMIKPNLSTAHARAETSDAKWMTLAEIQALDKAGKLHHPIAGGKLESNVISLYPASGQTLGQIARPGPVTKRQGRLAMPPGGRQAPANFNAWPHAHKKSTGKNLVGDKTAIDKLRQDVKQGRKAYDGKTGDGRLAAIGAMQGFDDTPTVVSKSEIDRLLATGDYIEAFRGVKGAYGGPSAAKINEDMRSGTAWYGRGIFGNGYYLATQKSVAQQYSDHSKNSVVRMLIPKSALMEKYKPLEREARSKSSRTSKAKGVGYEDGTLYDVGRWAAAKGLDGIQIDHDTTNDTHGWARHIAKPGQPAFNWLNRSVLIIQEAD